MPSHIYDEPQSYFIYGGLAFVALTEPYLHEWGDEWMSDAPHELVNLVMAGIAELPDEQPVSRPYSKYSRSAAPTVSIAAHSLALQPHVLRAAALCTRGCSPMRARLQHFITCHHR